MCLSLKRNQVMWIALSLFILMGVCLIGYSLMNPQSIALTLLSACSTYAVVLVTLVYAITTSEQRDVMASQLSEMHGQRKLMADQLEEIRHDHKIQRLNKEMDFVVGPLRSKIGSFKVYEPLFLEECNEQTSIAFWEDIKKNLYLASADLHVIVMKYLAVFEEQKEKLRKTRYEVRIMADNYVHENGIVESMKDRYLVLLRPAPVNEGYNSYLKFIEDGNKQIGYDSSYGKTRSWFLELANENHIYDIRVDGNLDRISIHYARDDLERAVQQRYDAVKNELSEAEVGSREARP